MSNLKVLCIHGIGGKDEEMNDINGWVKDWRDFFTTINFTHPDNVEFMKFDTFFEDYNADTLDYMYFFHKAFLEKTMLKSRDDFFDKYPDMVVEFLLYKKLREDLRNALKKQILEFKPDIIYAHSLGSMMCYDFFTQPENNCHSNIIMVSAGSQLGNPRLKNFDLKQPLELLPIKFWYNLNNPKDNVFAKHEINLPENKNYVEVTTKFKDSIINHDGFLYLSNPEAVEKVWNKIKVG